METATPHWLNIRSLVETETRKMLDANGLSDWSIVWEPTTSFVGRCVHDTKTIKYSSFYMKHMKKEDALSVVSHEVAHAAVGPGKAHGPQWRDKCIELGGTGVRGANVKIPLTAAQKKFLWVGVCPHCEQLSLQNSAPRSIWLCSQCDAPQKDRIFDWHKRGVYVAPANVSKTYAEKFEWVTRNMDLGLEATFAK